MTETFAEPVVWLALGLILHEAALVMQTLMLIDARNLRDGA